MRRPGYSRDVRVLTRKGQGLSKEGKEALKRISPAFVHCDGLQGGAQVGSGRPRVEGIEGLGSSAAREEDRPMYVTTW